MSKNNLGLKLISAFILITGLLAIYTVIGEILELDTISTPPRILDIVIRVLIVILSPIVAYGIWNTKGWSFIPFFFLIVLEIALRSLIFFSPHFTLEKKMGYLIAIIVFIIIAIYVYTKRELFKKSEDLTL